MSATATAISGYENSSNTNHIDHHHHHYQLPITTEQMQVSVPLSRYESQKRRDWNTFGQYLKNHRPPLTLSRCSGAHVLEFLRYLDQFGKTKVHAETCAYFGNSHPPGPCPCPLKQAWGSLDALIGRLRAAFEENGGNPEINPFGARAVRLYLREVRDAQAKARGIAYEKKKRRRNVQQLQHQQNESMMVVVVEDPVHNVNCSGAVQYSSPPSYHNNNNNNNIGGGGFVQLSNSDGAAPNRDHDISTAVSYFSS